MIVRCERCRTVYALSSGQAAVAVECSSCGFVFVARPVARFDLGGRYGGAASKRVDTKAWDPAAAARAGFARRRRRWRPWAVAAAIGLALGASVGAALRHSTPSASSAGALAALLAPVWPAIRADDPLAFEQAMARLDAWLQANPDDPAALATAAWVTALAAADWAAEADDTDAEVSRAALPAPGLEDLRKRLGPARTTADRWLLRAEKRAARALALAPENRAREALVIIAAARGDRAAFDRSSASLPSADPWRAYAWHYLQVRSGEAADTAPLERALQADPSWVRWSFELARGRLRAGREAPESAASMQAFAKAHPAHAAGRRWMSWIGAASR